jgi:hypothetical protein
MKQHLIVGAKRQETPREKGAVPAPGQAVKKGDAPLEGSTSASIDTQARQQMIREAAYRLYEERGRADGHDQEDWLAAE